MAKSRFVSEVDDIVWPWEREENESKGGKESEEKKETPDDRPETESDSE